MSAQIGGDCNGNLPFLGFTQWTGSDEAGHTATRDESASVYAAAGWSIFPCAGKVPVTKRGLRDAAPDAAPWRSDPKHDIGWALPPGSWALDIDPRHGGAESLRVLQRQHAPAPMTLWSTTGSGGWHWVFRDTPGRPVRQLAGFLPGLDTRVGGRGYLIVAPSIHPITGRAYRWLSTIAPVEAPAWLLDLVAVPQKAERPVYEPPEAPDANEVLRRSRYALATLERLAAEVAGAAPGQRNFTLNKAWFRIAGFRDVVDEALARAVLTKAALGCGLADREICKVLR